MDSRNKGTPIANPATPAHGNSGAVKVATRQILASSPAGRAWTIHVVSTPGECRSDYYHADVFLGDVFLRRIVLDTAFENKIAAEVALTVAARKWVSEYEGGDHSGSTDFGELHE